MRGTGGENPPVCYKFSKKNKVLKALPLVLDIDILCAPILVKKNISAKYLRSFHSLKECIMEFECSVLHPTKFNNTDGMSRSTASQPTSYFW